jgi:hypothetical protein
MVPSIFLLLVYFEAYEVSGCVESCCEQPSIFQNNIQNG